MKQLVILPGGFHPYHAGHYALYQSAVEAFPDADVYVAATADTSTRPFPFELKQKLAKLAGVPADRFVQVKSPFRAQEIVSKYDPEDTQLIFVRSDKDRGSQPQPGGTKKDGSPSYLQPWTEREQLPLTQRGYMAYLPTVEFGPGMKSATEIRTAWPQLNDKRKQALVMSLYPKTQKNPKLAQNVVNMLDSVLGENVSEFIGGLIGGAVARAAGAGVMGQLAGRVAGTAIQKSLSDNNEVDENQGWAATLETTLVNDPEQGMQIRPEGGMGTWSEKSLVTNLVDKFQGVLEMLRDGRYQNLYYVLYSAGATEAMVKALADLEGFRERQGRRPIAPGREIQVGEADGQTAGTPAVGGMRASYQARENQPQIDYVEEKWSAKYKRSINCNNPRGFSQKAHCAGRKK
jgi:hypothetical protein